MLFVELIAALLLGFVLGRIWEIRQRVMLAGRADEQRRRIGSSVVLQVSARPPKDENELVATFDREMKELVAAVAAKGRHLSQVAQPRR